MEPKPSDQSVGGEPHEDSIESIRQEIARVRGILAKTSFLMNEVDARSSRIESLADKASELLNNVGQKNPNGEESKLSEDDNQKLDGAADGLESIIEAITGNIKALQQERSEFFNRPVFENSIEAKDNQHQKMDGEELLMMIDVNEFIRDISKPEITPMPEITPASPQELPDTPSQPEIQPNMPPELPPNKLP